MEITEEELEKYSTKELKGFRNLVDYILYRRNSEDREYPSILYRYLAEELNGITKKKYPEYYVFISKESNKKTDKKLLTTSQFLLEYLEEVQPGADKTTIIKFFKLFAELMVSNMNGNLDLPLNFTTVLSMAEDFPSILERAFPGYVQSGKLFKLL